jgi:hypothetical protein
MEETRESISSTVTEIKESVANQVEHIKDALDWREHFKKQPVAWSVGAFGVGFFAGYGLAAAIKGEAQETRYSTAESLYPASSRYSAQPLLGQQGLETGLGTQPNGGNGEKSGPGLLARFKETSAYDRLSREAGTIGDRLVEELSETAQNVVLPALLLKFKEWIGLDLSSKGTSQRTSGSMRGGESSSRYEPVAERQVYE